jgi:hypothetical protein
MNAGIQFIRGVNEAVVPDVKLTRSKDGSSGTALFVFEQPTVFESASELGEITGLYLVDEEGVLQVRELWPDCGGPSNPSHFLKHYSTLATESLLMHAFVSA